MNKTKTFLAVRHFSKALKSDYNFHFFLNTFFLKSSTSFKFVSSHFQANETIKKCRPT